MFREMGMFLPFGISLGSAVAYLCSLWHDKERRKEIKPRICDN